MTWLINKTIPSVCNHCHRKSKITRFLLTYVDSIYPGGSRATDHAYWSPLPCAWAHHMGTMSTAFCMCDHYCACPQWIPPAQTKEKRCEGKFCGSMSFVDNYLTLSDLGGRGRAVPMYYSAHAQWVQRAGESIWASWQNNSWEQVATASHNCLLSSCFPRNSKEEERSQEPGESLCCLQPWDLDWAPSGWQDSHCGQTFKYNSIALILLIIFVGHHEN